MQSATQARAHNLASRLDRAGIPYTLTRKGDGLTRVWVVDGRRMSTRQAERYAQEARA